MTLTTTSSILTSYICLLRAHDWQFEFSDDHRVYRAGRAALATLRIAQKQCDTSGEIWNTYAPEGYKLPTYDNTKAETK
jgi:hypothetical protein